MQGDELRTALIDVVDLIRERGNRAPTIETAMAIARALNLRFANAAARAAIRDIITSGATRRIDGGSAADDVRRNPFPDVDLRDTRRIDGGSAADGKNDSVALDVRAPADLKGFGLSGMWSSGTSSPHPTSDGMAPSQRQDDAQPTLGFDIPAKPKKHRSGHEPSPKQLAAWAIRDRIAALVKPHLNGMTLDAWKRRNGPAAADLAAADVDPDEIAEFWLEEFDRTGSPVIMLHYLQDRFAARRPLEASGLDRYDIPFYDPDELDSDAATG